MSNPQPYNLDYTRNSKHAFVKDEILNSDQNQYGKYTSKNNKIENKIQIKWNKNFTNYDGVKPPNPTVITGSTNPGNNGYPLFQIEAREPYKVQYLRNQYGGLNTRMGTELGR